mmetsp:Transcript_48908/g.141681  ORF Transcript_48908/g.141681 Transcript_48908/m.141681 type:complete len:535 (+) Transcript_48908:68-1672(+)
MRQRLITSYSRRLSATGLPLVTQRGGGHSSSGADSAVAGSADGGGGVGAGRQPRASPAGVLAAVAGVGGAAAGAWLLRLQQQREPGEAGLSKAPVAGDCLVDLPALRVDGAKVDPCLRLRNGLRGRGLFVEGDVREGTVLLSVPPSAVLSPERAGRLLLPAVERPLESGQGDAAAEGALQWGLLPALLAQVRAELEAGRPGSFGLGAYVEALPRSFPSLPLFLEPQDAERELHGTALLPATLQLRARLLEDRDVAKQVVERGGQNGSADISSSMWSGRLWLWACSILLTRGGLGLSLAGSEYGLNMPSLALVPLMDFANCDCSAPTCEVRAGPGGEVCLVTLRALTSGDEATFDYGTRSHEQTLFTFGYLPNAGELAVTTPLQLSCEDGTGVRQALLRLLALDQQEEQLAGPAPAARLRRSAGALGPADVSELVAAANLLEMNISELKVVAGQVASTGGLPPQLGHEAVPATRRRLVALLEAWSAELQQQSSDPATSQEAAGADAGDSKHLEPLRRYRSECAALVGEALQLLRS